MKKGFLERGEKIGNLSKNEKVEQSRKTGSINN